MELFELVDIDLSLNVLEVAQLEQKALHNVGLAVQLPLDCLQHALDHHQHQVGLQLCVLLHLVFRVLMYRCGVHRVALVLASSFVLVLDCLLDRLHVDTLELLVELVVEQYIVVEVELLLIPAIVALAAAFVGVERLLDLLGI